MTMYVVAQCLACGGILWHGIPFYRKLLLIEQSADPKLYAIAIGCTTVLQFAYWRAYALRDCVVVKGTPRWGHLLQFSGRLIFSFASAMFSVVFFVKFNELDLRAWKLALLLALLFSLFCFAQQIEWLGASMNRKSGAMVREGESR